ncbi:MAG: hypothetical protein H8K10_15455 [Nitrospira sp.]|nr:hypothetical protein [Nitrospira sp.]
MMKLGRLILACILLLGPVSLAPVAMIHAASTDASPRPLYGVAYRVVFPLFDNTGSLVTGAAGLDTEISKDQGTFADATNEATEIATSSGMYYLDLTASEMTARTVAIIVKTSTTNAKTTPLVLYPELILVRGVCGSSSTTTSIITSSLTPAAAVTDQFKGRIVIFEATTTTANLRGQVTDITGSTSGGVLTVSALSTACASGDTFMIQ